jgi:very-short-patch-repair endonuclease
MISDMTTTSTPLLRNDLVLSGVRPAAIQSNLRSKRWEAPYRGIYLDAGLESDAKRRATQQAHLLRAGPSAALSHHSAAELHGFDSTAERPSGTWIVTAHFRRIRCPDDLTLTRSRVIAPQELTLIEGLAVTSRARTVLDLASILDENELERVVESALRGPDHKRPDRWRPEVLAELAAYAAGDRRRPGASALAACLARRDGVTRPTGSIAETAMIQYLRAAGVSEVIRQPALRIVGHDGKFDEVFPDILVGNRRLILEVDGGEHRDPRRHRADLARQNKLLLGFELVRCTGADALFDGERVASEVAAYPVLERSGSPFGWETGTRLVEGVDVKWSVRPKR